MNDGRFGRLGLIATISPDDWPKDFVAHTAAGFSRVREILKGMGFEVLDCGTVARTRTEMASQGRELAARRINALVIFVGTWAYATGAVSAAFECDVPVVVWADATEGRYGICGGGVLKGSLDEAGIRCSLVYGRPDEPETLQQVRDLCIGATSATRLRGLSYGLGGSGSMGMGTALIDAGQWASQFGITVDGFEQVEVIRRSEQVPDSEARSFLQWMRETFGKVEPAENVMIRQIKLYLALKKMIEENGYDFISVKCLPELPACHTTLCLAHSMLNSTCDASGRKATLVCGCEADSNGALTMQLLKHVTGEAVLFADVLQVDRKDNILRLCNCGSQATDFASRPKDVWWMKESMPQFEWKIGSTHPQYVSRPGRVTLARLSRVKGRYVMLIAGGEAVALDREILKETNFNIAHTFVRFDSPLANLVKILRSNHIHAAYGDVAVPLGEACEILGIEVIRV